MEAVDTCLDDAVNTILSQTNNKVPIDAILSPEQNLEEEEGLTVGTDGKPRTIPACNSDTFYLLINVSEKKYGKILVGDVPKLHDPDSIRSTYYQEAVRKIRNDTGYMLRRLLKSERKILFTSKLMNLERQEVTKELVDRLCPDDDLKKSIAPQYDFLTQ